MTEREREATADELLAMAYVDGELAPEERRKLEERMPREPALVREIAAQQRLAVLAREVAPREPLDHEWKAIATSTLQRIGMPLAWTLIAIGAGGLALWCEWQVCCAAIGLAAKIFISSLAAGLGILFLLALRARARTRRYDPYTDVKR